RILGLRTASADEAAREIFDEPETQAELARLLQVSPPISRDLLRARLSEEAAVRRSVSKIFHARIRRSLMEGGFEAVEIPLLLETCLWHDFDAVWFVHVDRSVLESRLALRLGSLEAAQAQLSGQAPPSAKSALADVIVSNSGTPEDLGRFIEDRLKEHRLAERTREIGPS
ncbi:MAG: dephospho-CoA kinase, partial [Fimbriimonadaceae bacterium]|nr:dephospho-CoA kinase [Fimbriimonadaceae bacterium]